MIPITPHPRLGILWGTASTCPLSHDSPDFPLHTEQHRQQLGLSSLWQPHQKHTTLGFTVEDDGKNHCDFALGDYTITSDPNVGLSVITADCIPLILFDPTAPALAAVHSGWKGTVGEIALKAMWHLQKDFSAEPRSTLAFIGPHAKVCCYEVQADFIPNVPEKMRLSTLINRSDKLYFDNLAYTSIILENAGLFSENIHTQWASCTLCTPGYNSRRKMGPSYASQASIAWIKSL